MEDVDRTAVMVAACRAIEQADPYAAWLVGAAQAAMPAPVPVSLDGLAAEEAGTWRELAEFVGVRTREFDGWLAGASQVVLLAAGLDTRAYRLSWPSGAIVYELDRPGVLDFKGRVLGEHGVLPSCERRPVRVDLRDDWGTALLAAGFEPSVPTAWLAEGLLPYLPAGAEVALFAEVDRLSAAGSVIAVEYIADMTASLSGVMATTGRTTGVDVPGLVHDDQRDDRPRPRPEALLADLGWSTTSTTGAETARTQARPGPLTPLLDQVVYAYGHRP